MRLLVVPGITVAAVSVATGDSRKWCFQSAVNTIACGSHRQLTAHWKPDFRKMKDVTERRQFVLDPTADQPNYLSV